MRDAISTSGNLPALFATCVVVGLALGSSAPSRADTSAAEFCLAVNHDISLGSSLPRTAARLQAGGPVKIVAIGSSSTKGLWMLRPAATYPEVMRRELEGLWPGIRIEVVNSGRTGDTIAGSIKRFDRDVFALQPDVVIWQLGTNDVAWGGNVQGLEEKVTSGVKRLKASGADVILMDLQFAPQVLASPYNEAMETIISDTARQESVGLFSRFALMRQSVEAGLPQGALVAWDGLHNSRDGYDCIGRALGRAIHNAVQ